MILEQLAICTKKAKGPYAKILHTQKLGLGGECLAYWLKFQLGCLYSLSEHLEFYSRTSIQEKWKHPSPKNETQCQDRLMVRKDQVENGIRKLLNMRNCFENDNNSIIIYITKIHQAISFKWVHFHMIKYYFNKD